MQINQKHNRNKTLKLAALYSGGKDSAYSLLLNQLSGKEIMCLISLKPEEDSMMFHNPMTNVIKTISKAVGISLISKKATNDNEMTILEELLNSAKKKYNINGIITGAIASEYQRMRINLIAENLNLRVFSPLWHKDFDMILDEESQYLDFTIVKIMSEGLNKELVGKIIKEKEINIIQNSKLINHAFEGGEAETLALDSPLFKKRIQLKNKKVTNPEPYVYILKSTLKLKINKTKN